MLSVEPGVEVEFVVDSGERGRVVGELLLLLVLAVARACGPTRYRLVRPVRLLKKSHWARETLSTRTEFRWGMMHSCVVRQFSRSMKAVLPLSSKEDVLLRRVMDCVYCGSKMAPHCSLL